MADVETGERPQLANLMGMATSAEQAGNHQEAISYYNRVLETDPTIAEAWLGKGRAAGWLSTLANVRIAETLVAFGHAIGAAPEEERAAVAARAQDDLLAIAGAIGVHARQHYTRAPTVPEARRTYIVVTAGLLDALHQVRDWKPGDRACADLTVQMTRVLLDTGVEPGLAVLLKERMQAANGVLASLDPAYQPPVLAGMTEKQKADDQVTMQFLALVGVFVLMFVIAIVAEAAQHS